MNYLLFTTTRCPKCPAFKEFVQKFTTFSGTVINENDEKFGNLTTSYNISAVPHIVVFEGDSQESKIFETNDATELYSFLNGHAH
jgi:hypothetical protein